MSMIESMSNNNQKEMTIAELAKEMREGFKEMLEAELTTHESLQELRRSVRELEKGAFTEKEKEEVLAMVRHYDRWLEEDTVGKNRITLTREEYEAATRAQGFPNRFVRVPVVDIE